MMPQTALEDYNLTSQEIELVQETWGRVGDSVELAVDFYNRLFYLYPDLRPLFKEDLRLQARKFTAHLTYLIKNLHNWTELQGEIEALGKRHTSYEVKSHHYHHTRDALFYALKVHLADDWNTPSLVAWNKFYNLIADLMMGSFHKR